MHLHTARSGKNCAYFDASADIRRERIMVNNVCVFFFLNKYKINMEHIAESNSDYMGSPAKMQLSKNNKSSIWKLIAHLKYPVLTIFILLMQEVGFSQNDSAQRMSVYDS